jgi:multidrug efflux system outer membrane protein
LTSLSAAGAAVFFAILVTVLSGCAVGPEYVRPELSTNVPAAFAATTARVDSTLVPARWWEALGDPQLDELVDQALSCNLTLQQASAAVLEARASVRGARSERFPSATVGGTAVRSKQNLSGSGVPQTIHTNNFDANVTVSWELDLWGRLARADESARASLLSSEANRRAVVHTLVADVVRTWLTARELQCQLGLTLRTVESYQRTVHTIEQRFANGVVPALDVRLARQNLLGARAGVPDLQQQLTDAIRALEILAGRYPAASALAAGEAAVRRAVMPGPLPEVPVGLPSKLLERRPDLMVAEANLHANVANIGATKARLYPTVTLTRSGGYSSDDLNTWLFDTASNVWSLAGNLVMPLINRGATLAQVQAAEARAEQAVASYHLTLLTAFAEVESALDAERFQAAREDELSRWVTEARRSLELAQRRYESGLDPFLTTLESQRRLLSAESQFLSTQRAHRAARVDLIQALGGSWDLAIAHEDPASAHPQEGDDR